MLHLLAYSGIVGAGGNGCLMQTVVAGTPLAVYRNTSKGLAALREETGNQRWATVGLVPGRQGAFELA